MDSIDFIELLDSNILEDTIVTITEERLKDDSSVYYNDKQVKSHLISLLYDKNVKPRDIIKKADVYFDILTRKFRDIGKQKDISLKLSQVKTLKPIISCLQKVYFVDDDDYEHDADFEADEKITMLNFDLFLDQFNNFNRDVSNPASQTSQKLYNLYKPFESVGDINIKSSIDALDEKNRRFRLVGESELYKGDAIRLVGFYNNISLSKATFLEKAIHIDMDAYHTALNELKDGDAVVVCFNEFILDVRRNVIENIEGKVTGGKVFLSKVLKRNNISVEVLDIHGENYFIFPKSAPVMFNKSTIFNNDVLITSSIDAQSLLKLVYPSNVNEALLIERNKIFTMDDITSVLESYGMSTDIEEELRYIIEYLIKPHTVYKNQIAEIKELKPTFKKPDSIQYFPKWLSKLQTFKSGLSKSELNKQLQSHNNDLDMLVKRQEAQPKREVPKIIIAKVYTDLDSLNEDNEKICYFDKDLDDTDHSLKGSLASVDEVESELTRLKKYKDMSGIELKREADSIFHGKRKVLPGEYAELHELNKRVLYVRKTVDGKDIWVHRIAIDKCQDIVNYESLDEINLLNTYDNACKDIEYFKLNKAIQNKKAIIANLNALISFCNFDVSSLTPYFGINNSRNAVFSKYLFDKLKVQEIDDIAGLLDEQQARFLTEFVHNTEGADFDSAPIPLANNNINNPAKTTEQTMLDIIVTYIDLIISDGVREFIQLRVNNKYSRDALDQDLAAKRQALLAKANRALYETNREYRKKLDEKIEEKLKPVFDVKYREYYYSIITYTCAMLSCVVMTLYPNIEFGKLIPRCVSKFLPYGHPYNENKGKSLEGYLACCLQTMAIPDDIKYAKLVEKSNEDIEKDIRKNIDIIISEDYIIAGRLELNKGAFSKYNPKKVAMETTTLRDSFKPNFNFTKESRDINIKFLKYINDIVKGSKYTKTTFKKSASLTNSCCPEILNEEYDFYNMFQITKNTGKESFKDLHAKVALSLDNIKYDTLIPKVKSIIVDTKLDNKNIVFNNFEFIRTKIEEKNIHKDIKTDEYYNTTLYPSLKRKYGELTDDITRYVDSSDKAKINFINETLIMGMSEDVSLVRMTLFNYLKSKLRTIIGQLQNGAVPLKKETEFDKILISMRDMNRNINIPSSTDEIVLRGSSVLEDHIKDIGDMMDVFVDYLLQITEVFKQGYKRENNKDYLLMGFRIANHCIVSLYEYLNNNIVDLADVTKQVETLREQGKQRLMDSYLADDDERQLQIQLRNLGLDSWSTVFDKVKALDLSKVRNKKEENDNYNMAENKGENADDNIEEDVDLIRVEY